MIAATWEPPETGSRPVVVLGAGVLGRRIACLLVVGGYKVNIRDPSAKALEDAAEYIESCRAEYAVYVTKKAQRQCGSFAVYTSLDSAVQNAWLIIEAIPERLDMKVEMFGELDQKTPRDCILGSNSSSYKSSQMLAMVSAHRKRQILNIHFSMPPRIRTVELMTDGYTSPEVILFVQTVMESCALMPVIVNKESTGFIMNRLWAAIKREILQILAEGVSTPEQIDQLWDNMFRDGSAPCQLMDEIGLDTVALIEDNYVKERGLDGRLTVDWLRENYVLQGRLGNKSDRGGLYKHPDDVASGI